MKNRHTITFAIGIRRAIAIALAVSMLLIPVHMPGASAENYENLVGTPGYTYDVKDDVTYKWNGDGKGTFSISNGKLQLKADLTNKESATAWLSGTAEDGTNVVSTWKNYTVEATVKGTFLSGYKLDAPAIIGAVSADGETSYGWICYSDSAYPVKITATGISRLKDEGVRSDFTGYGSGDEITLKMAVSGQDISFYVNGVQKYAYKATEDLVGGFGLRANYFNGTAVKTSYFNDVEVTVDGETVYADDFGEDVTYKWSADANYVKVTDDGKLTIKTHGGHENVVLSGTAGDDDVVGSWTNYTVEALVDVPTHRQGKFIAPAIMGKTNSGKACHLVCGWDSNASKIVVTLFYNGKRKEAAFVGDNKRPVLLKLTFAGDKVTASYSYYESTSATTMTSATSVNSQTVTSSSDATGIGFRANYWTGDKSATYTFDYFKVTVGGDEVFKDDFENNKGFTDAGLVMPGVYTPSDYKVVKKEAYTRWSMSITSDTSDCEKATVTINDYDTENTVKVNGEDVLLTDGTGTYEINQPGNHTITAKDADGKEVTKNIKVGHEYKDDGSCANCNYVCQHEPEEADGNCTNDINCKKCGKVAIPGAVNHIATGEWIFDGTSKHYKVCKNTFADGSQCKEPAIIEDCYGGTGNCQNKPVCEGCHNEYTAESNHDKNEDEWEYNDTNHWRECNVDGCEEHLDEAPHTGGTANCQAGKKCETCGKEYTDKDPNNHNGTSEWDKTETTHKKVYTCCGAQDPAFAEEEHNWENGGCTVCGDGCEHTGGTGNCQNKPVCEICGEAYGKLGDHDWKTEWTTDGTDHWHECKVEGCTETKDKTGHTPEEDDGDCTTEIKCSVCKAVTTEAADGHKGGSATCEDKAKCTVCGKEYGVHADHKGGTATCTEKARCTVCDQLYGEVSVRNHSKEVKWIINGETHKQVYTCCDKAIINEGAHIGGEATCSEKAKCTVCGEAYGELAAHTGGEATCSEKAKCTACGEAYGELNADKHGKEAKWFTTADKHGKAYECCGKVVVEAGAHTGGTATCKDKAKCTVCGEAYGELAAHTGGTATCKDKAKCTVCGEAYGELAAHTGGEATCTEKAKCTVCGEAYGELNADKHGKEAKWFTTADKHGKAYECCGKVVVAEEAHEWKDSECTVCGFEAELGSENRPIEIKGDNETVKEEAKVEAGAEQHFALDEKLAGKVITVKGENAYVVVDGKKHEAKNGAVEVKLPTKTGKISVVIGNAGTKAGSFSITIATPDEGNSDTGDNTPIVLICSLLAMSLLAGGVLLIPGIRKKLLNK